MRDLVFLDIETTGLDPDKHQAWEIAAAVNDEPVISYVLVHSLQTADEKALELNGYFLRYPDGARSLGPMVDIQFRKMLKDVTIVAANPSFDVDFLYRRWGVAPWHHRKLDIETMAYTVFEYDEMKGMKDIASDLTERGFYIRQPDHTAHGDVTALRDCYKALRAIQRGLVGA